MRHRTIRWITHRSWWKAFLAWKEFDTFRLDGEVFFLLRSPRSLSKDQKTHWEAIELTHSKHNGIYVNLGWWLFPWTRPNTVDRMFTKSYGRFGNQIVEAACAVEYALQTGVKQIIPEVAAPFRLGTHPLQGVALVCRESTIARNSVWGLILGLLKPSRAQICLRGAWCLTWIDSEGKFQGVPDGKIYQALGKFIKWPPVNHEPSDTEVVIHIRSGDAFAHPTNPTYGQPPLSYYQLCILQRNWSKVWVVSEDHANPVVDALLLWLEENEINHEYHSEGFEADVSLIIGAKNIIASRGTFVASLAASQVSPPIVYVMGEQNLPIRIENALVVKDSCGNYEANMFRRNWRGTAEQLELMTTYPMECLSPPRTR